MLAPILAIGLPLAIAAAAFVYFRRAERRGLPVVVDERTLRLTATRADVAAAAGDAAAAYGAMTAIVVWLRGEVQTGPARRRVRRASQLERWELRRAQLPSRERLLPDAGEQR